MLRQLVKEDAWRIIQDSYDDVHNEIYESLMSIGNGFMGVRGNHEEPYSGHTLQGTYYAGIYYPDKTRVGWWKNGYPEYFAKVLNGIEIFGLKIWIDNELLDLNTWHVTHYERILDMKNGVLTREFIAKNANGLMVEVHSERFMSKFDRETAALKYEIKPLNFNANIKIETYLNGDIRNKDANYGEHFWTPDHSSVNTENEFTSVSADTQKTHFRVACSSKSDVYINGSKHYPISGVQDDFYASVSYEADVIARDHIVLYKYIGVATNRDFATEDVVNASQEALFRGFELTYDAMKAKHTKAWESSWAHNDIVIDGDIKAQQAIRFNIFHMNQTYTGEDPRLNIGPKGFTGEKYGGSTYWDTEAYCMFFYLGTADAQIARNLLIYRHTQLPQAKENAKKLGCDGALYPMVTMTGEECHNEWEITFEEIHRNGAIAYAIYHYVRYTGDSAYLLSHGAEVLIEIARYWKSRVNYVPAKDCYMILGVTGPNEYENNINNNWYTNKIAAWCLEYAAKVCEELKLKNHADFEHLALKLDFNDEEIAQWQSISEKMYYPFDDLLGIYLQQDGYLDKEQRLVSDLDYNDLPLNQKWSWDRILRSCFIKQADVLQGMFFFEHEFERKFIERHFNFYEPRTVHESSLSPCVHSILASRLGHEEKAYEMYMRTSRLDLDNYNHDTEDGLHITSMAGTWMSVVLGFGGVRVTDSGLEISPKLPELWNSLSFRLSYRGRILNITVDKNSASCRLMSGEPLDIIFNDTKLSLTE